MLFHSLAKLEIGFLVAMLYRLPSKDSIYFSDDISSTGSDVRHEVTDGNDSRRLDKI